MEKNKLKKLDINARQMELIKKYYPVDEEKHIVTFRFKYINASDMFICDLNEDSKPLIKPEIIDRVSDELSKIPLNYSINLEFEVDNWEDYNKDEIIESFNDALELRQFSGAKNRANKFLTSALLIITGIILLCFMVFANNDAWFGEGVWAEILIEVIDIIAWVFIWEAVTLLFLEPNEKNFIPFKIKKRINNVSIFKKGQKEPIAINDDFKSLGEWSESKKLKRFSKLMILVSSSIFVCLAFYNIFNLIAFKGIDPSMDTTLVALTITHIIIDSVIKLIAGAGGLSKYMNRNNWLTKFGWVYSVIIMISLVFSLVGIIINKDISAIPSTLITLLANIAFAFGYIGDKYIK